MLRLLNYKAMSRIGILPINIPAGVTVSVDKNIVTVKGKEGELSQSFADGIEVEVKDAVVSVSRKGETKDLKSQHGLIRSLLQNMVKGVSEMYEIKLELVGVGYKAVSSGQRLDLSLGYSHPIIIEIASEVKIEATAEKRQNSIITLRSIDKQLVGQVAAKIRSFRKPEPYKGKGVKFVGEELRRKAGKTAGAK